MNIQHDDNKAKGRFFVNDNGIDLAQMVYSWVGNNLIIIEHTEVDDQLKGQGVDNKLVAACVDWARSQMIKILPLCPFAKVVFERKPEYSDVLYRK